MSFKMYKIMFVSRKKYVCLSLPMDSDPLPEKKKLFAKPLQFFTSFIFVYFRKQNHHMHSLFLHKTCSIIPCTRQE